MVRTRRSPASSPNRQATMNATTRRRHNDGLFKLMRQLLPLLFVGFILTVMIFIYLDHQDPELNQEWLNLLKLEFPDYYNSNDYQMDKVPMACTHPKLDLFDRTMITFFHLVPPIKCSDEPNWIYTDNGYFYIKEKAIKNHGDIQCSITFFKRKDDHNIQEVQKFDNFSSGSELIEDLFKVNCSASDGKTYSNVHAAIYVKAEIEERINKFNAKQAHTHRRHFHPPGKGLDVFILGINSLSRMTFMRKLPKTYKYITGTMKGIVMKGYNTIGEQTPQSIIPMFTGKTERELSETHGYVNEIVDDIENYPFIWNSFRKEGYVTAYGSDMPMYETFVYSLKAGLQHPLDHFLDPFYVAMKLENWNNRPHCFGDTPHHLVLLNFFKDFWIAHQNYSRFSFAFLSKYSRSDYNQIGAADEDIEGFLKYMHESGYFNKTMFVMLSDHGHRSMEERATQQSKQEERMPMLAFVFPSWFEHLHPHAIRNFHINSNRLISPFDLYTTFHDIIFDNNKNSNLLAHSISLFKEIPSNRTCENARIKPHWCACLTREPVHVNDINVQKSAKALVNFINSLTEKYREKCAVLNLRNVTSVIKYVPEEKLLKFKKMKAKNKYEPEFTGVTRVSILLYHLVVETKPDDGLFEAWPVIHDIKTDYFTIRAPDIYRINENSQSASCITRFHEDLRKYCHCKT